MRLQNYLKIFTFFATMLLSISFAQTKDNSVIASGLNSTKFIKLDRGEKICLCCRPKGDTTEWVLIVIDKWTVVNPSFRATIDLLNPDNIATLNVYHGNDSIAKSYGDKAKNGLIIVKLKPDIKLYTLTELLDKFHVAKNDQKLKVCINKILLKYPEKILFDPTSLFSVEVISDIYWINGTEMQAEERFLNFVTNIKLKNGM